MQEIFEATVEKIIFYNQDNNYTIAKVQDTSKKRDIIVTGTFIDLREGEHLKIWGEWINNKKYGFQVKVNTYISITPNTLEGIKKYLGSGLIKGIGPVMAERIVTRFGTQTIDILEKSIERLKEIAGIGDYRLSIIKDAWAEQKDIKDIMIFLHEKGVSATYAIKIYKTYHKKAFEILQKDPYRLAYDIFGIGFKTADTIAMKIGVSPHSLERAQAGLLYTLQERASYGHTYLPENQLREHTRGLLQTDDDIILDALRNLEKDKKVIRELDSENNDCIYLTSLHRAEENVVENIRRILLWSSEKRSDTRRSLEVRLRRTISCTSQGGPQVTNAVDECFSELHFDFTDDQRKAIERARNEKVVVITGGPGTGKTTITKALIQLFRKEKLAVSLCAPTGRAAKRMQELTDFPAKTVHRLLEFQPKTRTFAYNEERRLDTDVLIIDEASMLDILLADALFRALPEKTKVIIIGDVDQLPSVGPGNVLRDLISSSALPCSFLKEIFRQARESHIITNAHKVNNGLFPMTTPTLHRASDFFFLEREGAEEIVDEIKKVFIQKEQLSKTFNLSFIPQVLCPMNKGVIGTISMNKELQELINQKSDGVVKGSRSFRVRDRVIQLKNNYDKDIYNGDIGTISSIDHDLGEVTIDFEGRIVSYEFTELDELDLAYAITIHKSQGSEYESVIVPIHMQNFIMLERNLIYTAITRAKKLVILIGSRKALERAITTNRMSRRFSGLKNRLVHTINLL